MVRGVLSCSRAEQSYGLGTVGVCPPNTQVLRAWFSHMVMLTGGGTFRRGLSSERTLPAPSLSSACCLAKWSLPLTCASTTGMPSAIFSWELSWCWGHALEPPRLNKLLSYLDEPSLTYVLFQVAEYEHRQVRKVTVVGVFIVLNWSINVCFLNARHHKQKIYWAITLSGIRCGCL